MSPALLRVVASLVALGCTGCSRAPTPPPAPVVPDVVEKERPDTRVLDEDRACKTDAECTLTTVDCCGCDALGAQIGVRVDHVAALTARRRPICSALVCAQQMSDDPTCAARTAKCQSGTCVPYVPKP